MKIAFFDIDGTLTSEFDGSVPDSARDAIRVSREHGNLMFINTGRCFQNVEPRFRSVGFDGYVCGCGTHIVIGEQDLLHKTQSPETIALVRQAAREADVDILFESRHFVSFDNTRELHHPFAIRQKGHFAKRGYDMNMDVYTPDFTCDKFVIWYQNEDQLAHVRKTTDSLFDCIDRGGTFREFVPKGYSKASGIQAVLDHYKLPLDCAYAFGDSNNDLAMLEYVPGSVAMGNSDPEDLKYKVSYVTDKASYGGLAKALDALGFMN